MTEIDALKAENERLKDALEKASHHLLHRHKCDFLIDSWCTPDPGKQEAEFLGDVSALAASPAQPAEDHKCEASHWRWTGAVWQHQPAAPPGEAVEAPKVDPNTHWCLGHRCMLSSCPPNGHPSSAPSPELWEAVREAKSKWSTDCKCCCIHCWEFSAALDRLMGDKG